MEARVNRIGSSHDGRVGQSCLVQVLQLVAEIGATPPLARGPSNSRSWPDSAASHQPSAEAGDEPRKTPSQIERAAQTSTFEGALRPEEQKPDQAAFCRKP